MGFSSQIVRDGRREQPLADASCRQTQPGTVCFPLQVSYACLTCASSQLRILPIVSLHLSLAAFRMGTCHSSTVVWDTAVWLLLNRAAAHAFMNKLNIDATYVHARQRAPMYIIPLHTCTQVSVHIDTVMRWLSNLSLTDKPGPGQTQVFEPLCMWGCMS